MNGQWASAGSASALLGCLQFSVAATAAALVGVLHDGTALPMALVISLCGALAVTLAMLTRRLQHKRDVALQLSKRFFCRPRCRHCRWASR